VVERIPTPHVPDGNVERCLAWRLDMPHGDGDNLAMRAPPIATPDDACATQNTERRQTG